ncbi:MAG: DUF6624 domain-containing protein [Chitinophagaceae bacterium]
MKKQIAGLGLLMLLSQGAGAQGKLNKADSLYKEGQLMATIDEYNKMYNSDSTNYTIVYNLACAYAQGRMPDKAYRFLNLAVNLNTTEAALCDPDFLPLKKDKRWEDFEKNLVAQIQKKYEHPIGDEEYARKLWRMKARDQALYTDIQLAEKKIHRNSSIVYALWDVKENYNQQNQLQLEALIAKKGWPKISQVGAEGGSAAFLIIQHSDLEKQKKYLPLIKKLCEEKEAYWGSYALMYDRIQVAEHKPQRYGSQVIFNNNTNKYELSPMEDESKTDEWRKEIGMQALADYLLNWDIKWEPKTKQ